MTAPGPRRRADRAHWSLSDRIRWRVNQAGRGARAVLRAVRQSGLLILVGVLIVLGVFLGIRSYTAESRNGDRDEARKYQACTQRLTLAQAQNTANRVLRSALLTTRGRLLLQADRTPDAVLRRKYLANAQAFLEDRARISYAAEPDCPATYPRGFRESPRFPDLAPTRPATSGKSGPPRPAPPDRRP